MKLEAVIALYDNFSSNLNKLANRLEAGTSKTDELDERLSKTQETLENFGGVNISSPFDSEVSKLAQYESRLDALSDKYRYQTRLVSDLTQKHTQAVALWGKAHPKIDAIEKKLIDARLAQTNLNSTVEKTNSMYLKQYDIVERLKSPIDAASQQQSAFNDRLRQGERDSKGLLDNIKSFVGAYLGFEAIRRTAGAVGDWLGLTDARISSETQLANVMANMGATEAAYDSVLQKAAQMQNITPYATENFVAGAGEIATYLKSGEAIKKMMDTLADYAAGMGGVKVDKRAMVEYATQLGKVLDGQFDGIAKKGFTVSDMQQKILENGTEMERVAVVNDIIAQSWDGLAAAMANTPEGQMAQMQNTWDSMKSTLGDYLYPYVLRFFSAIQDNMPVISAAMSGFGTVIGWVVTGLTVLVEIAGVVGNEIAYWFGLASQSVDILSNALIQLTPFMVGIATYAGIIAARIAIITVAKAAWAAVTWVVAGAMAFLNAIITANPIMLLIAIVATAIAYFATWGAATKGLRNALADNFASMVDACEFAVNAMAKMINGLIKIINKAAEGLNSAFGTKIGTISLVDDVNFKGFRDKYSDVIRNAKLPDLMELPKGKGLVNFGGGSGANLDPANAETAKNTKGIKDAMGILDEDLKYMRDIADREYINNTSYSTVRIDMSGMTTTVNNRGDLDGFVDELAKTISERMSIAAEGVHS